MSERIPDEIMREAAKVPLYYGAENQIRAIARALMARDAPLQEQVETLKAERDAARFAERNAESLSSDAIHAIRELLTAHNVPLAAFIDDHVGNAIAQRDAAEAERDRLREALDKPTPAMIEDGVLAYNLTGIACGIINTAEDHVEFIWRAMSAALQKEPQP